MDMLKLKTPQNIADTCEGIRDVSRW